MQPALRSDRVGKLLSAGNRFAADLAGRVHRILLLNRRNNVGNRDPKFRQLVRLDPESHRVLACSENLDVADPWQASQWIVKVDIGVIGEKLCVVGAIGRVQTD